MGLIAKHIGHQGILKPLRSKNSKRQQMQELLHFANEKVPFYKGKYTEFLSKQTNSADIEFWSAFQNTLITTKQDLKTNNDSFKADHLESCSGLLDNEKNLYLLSVLQNVFIKKDFKISISTGGTSGVPTYRWLDHHDANIMAQSFLESFHLNGWRRGEGFVLYYPLRSYFTETYAAFNDWLHRLFGFSVVPFENVTKQSVLKLLQELTERKASLLVIFPCVLQRVAEIMHENGIEPYRGLKCINVSGEFFFDCSKSFIQKMFPDSIIEITYGAVEVGEIAHQSGQSSFDYEVFDKFAFVEETADEGMLITSLHQTSFPMIRYKMEDKASVKTDKNGKQFLINLEGKNTDYLPGANNKRHYASSFNTLTNTLNQDCNESIIHFMMRHQGSDAQLNFVLGNQATEKHKQTIQAGAAEFMAKNFPQFENLDIQFPAHFDHDYTRKFKIIGEGDGLAEVVGGYYKRSAS